MINKSLEYLLVDIAPMPWHNPVLRKISVSGVMAVFEIFLLGALFTSCISSAWQRQNYLVGGGAMALYISMLGILWFGLKRWVWGLTLLLATLALTLLCIFSPSFFHPAVSINIGDVYTQNLLFLMLNILLPLAVFKLMSVWMLTGESAVPAHKRTRYERQKHYLKYYDSLTRLPNRHHLLSELGNQVARAMTSQTQFAVMTIRVNYFRYIDQKYGSVIGDVLLNTIATNMCQLTRGHFMLVRLRGVVFCLVSKCYEDCRQVREAVDALYTQLPAVLTIKDLDIHLSYCCGVSVCPGNSVQPDELVKQSERALDLSRSVFSVKPVFFDSYLNAKRNTQIEVEIQLKKALRKAAFYTVFQPKVLHDGTIVGAEALVRMDEQLGDVVGPDLFIPAAERCGLIDELEQLVIVQLCRFIRGHLNNGIKLVPIAINISSRTICNRGYADNIIDTITEHKIPPAQIELEITETSLMTGKDVALQNLIKLRHFGIAISIDDFGSGYSSLGKIIDMPVSTLKIDRSFLREIPSDRNRVTLIRTIINLGKQLNMRLVAEGVERPEQLAFLHSEGCDFYQGFYFFKPMLESEFSKLVRKDYSTQ